jgi:tRNA (adenine57-N1/adenine58-N1)-methyltransferase catalytic subunit
MYEALTRDHEPAATQLPDVSMAIERIQGHEAKKERRRESQIAEAQRKREEKERKRKFEEGEAVEGDAEEGGQSKKARIDDEREEEDTPMDEASTTAASTPAPEEATSSSATAPLPLPTVATPSSSSKATNKNGKGHNNKKPPYVNPNHHTPKHMTFRAGAQTRGHTSYLTFATLLPRAGATASSEEVAVVEKVVEAVVGVAENGKEKTAPAAEVEEDEEFPMTEGDAEALLAVDMSGLEGK